MDEGERKIKFETSRKNTKPHKARLWTNLGGNTLAQKESC